MPRKQPILIARFFVFLFAIASAPTAAMGLYALGHDAMGIAPHSIMIACGGKLIGGQHLRPVIRNQGPVAIRPSTVGTVVRERDPPLGFLPKKFFFRRAVDLLRVE